MLTLASKDFKKIDTDSLCNKSSELTKIKLSYSLNNHPHYNV